MVNEEARKERHARLKKQDPAERPIALPVAEKASLFSDFISVSRRKVLKDVNNSPSVSQLFRKVMALVVTFLVVSPFMATYQLTQGSYLQPTGDFTMGDMDFIGEEARFTIEDVITEDGFLLKPAINSAEGDRTGSSEIFVYSVEPGDTLSSIAQRFNLKKETLMAENDLWNPNRLRVGFKLKILPVDGLSHVVKKGETIEKIAKTYKAEAEKIITQNQLQDLGEGELEANRVLIIPDAKREMPTYLASTAPANAANYSGPSASGRLIWPTIGQLTQGFHSGHSGIDIANRNKGPVYAAASGKVVKASTGWNGGYGNMIIIDHGNGMQTLYGHNEKLYVTEGQYVEQGQTISWMGNSGRVYGPTGIHVHFEVRIKGVKYNPMNFF
jgi:murein DD-endopeptidase MepM/ murein hydrolase activator NlpD